MKRIISTLLLLLVCSYAHADFFGAKVSLYTGVMKITGDYEGLQLGFSLNWKHLSIDHSHGIKRVEWNVPYETEWKKNRWQNGSDVAVRIYPFSSLQRYRPLITYEHMSDLLRGYPFNKQEEPSAEYFGIGVTAVRKHLEIDLTAGIDARECSVTGCAPGMNSIETQLQFRYVFWRQK